VSLRDVLARMPEQWRNGANTFLFRTPPDYLDTSNGTVEEIGAYLRFLNYPRFTPPRNYAPPVYYRLSGWYYKSGNEWFTPAVNKGDGSPVDTQTRRDGSPDIQAMAKNEAASNQRFTLTTRCSDTCTLSITGADGVKVTKTLESFRHGGIGFDIGAGHMHVDETVAVDDPLFLRTRADNLADRIRVADVHNFERIYLPLQAIGLIAFIATSIWFWRTAPFNVCYALALTSWVMAFSRLMLLAILGALYDTPAMLNAFYGAPTFFHLVCGSVLSIGACAQMFAARVRLPATAPAATGMTPHAA
jgi:hypothetical protein